MHLLETFADLISFDGHDDIYSVLKYMLNHSKKKRPISIDYVINELSRIMQKYKFVC